MSAFLVQEFAGAVAVTQSPTACGTGAFEVSVANQLIHSKLTMGHGKCNTDNELDAIINHITALIQTTQHP